jgi:hypothetical protein
MRHAVGLHLVVALALSGCQNEQYDKRVRGLMQEVAAMPECDGLTLDVFERLPGGGIDGNGYGIDISGTSDCRRRWVRQLHSDSRFHCQTFHLGSSCNRGALGIGETVTVQVGDGLVTRVIWIKDWSKA